MCVETFSFLTPLSPASATRRESVFGTLAAKQLQSHVGYKHTLSMKPVLGLVETFSIPIHLGPGMQIDASKRAQRIFVGSRVLYIRDISQTVNDSFNLAHNIFMRTLFRLLEVLSAVSFPSRCHCKEFRKTFPLHPCDQNLDQRHYLSAGERCCSRGVPTLRVVSR
jgi:hypothetical protein